MQNRILLIEQGISIGYNVYVFFKEYKMYNAAKYLLYLTLYVILTDSLSEVKKYNKGGKYGFKE